MIQTSAARSATRSRGLDDVLSRPAHPGSLARVLANRREAGVAVAVAYVFLALLTLQWLEPLAGLDLSRLIWLPSGLALAFVVHAGPRAWPWIFVGEVVVTWVAGGSFLGALGTGAGSTTEAVLAAWLLRGAGFSPSLGRWRDVVALVVLGGGVSSLLGGYISVSALVLSGGIGPEGLWAVTGRWWLTHANGIFLLTPVLLTLGSGLAQRVRRDSVEAGIVAGGLIVVSLLLFGTEMDGTYGRFLLYLPFPLLLWSAFRFRLAGAAWANVVLMVPAVVGTSLERGPLHGPGATETLLALSVFMVVCILTSLVLAGVVADREEESNARLAAEEERRRFSEQVHQAQKLESLGILAGGIAHDFNNLLATIMGNADLADRRLSVDDPAGDNVAEVLRASRRAADLCRQILAYAGRGKVSAQALDLREVVAEMTELLSVSFPKDARVDFVESGRMLPVWGDASQLRQVVLNLLTNASDALPGGAGRIVVTTGPMTAGEIRVRDIVAGEVPTGEELVHFTVEDDGPGMSPEVVDRVFEPFYSTKDVGRGLGLSVVSGIVRSHGGCLELRTAEGEGARFRMTLPATRRAIRPDRTVPFLDDLRFTGTAIVADDEEGVRYMCARMLEETGLDVVSAVDGVEAVEAFRRLGDEVALVVLDVTMPRMNGYDTLRAIRTLDPHACIILTSGNLQDVAAVEAEWGVPLLAKPYAARELTETLARVLRPVSPPQSAAPAAAIPSSPNGASS